MMIVSRLILKNWRNFRGVDVELGERMFIVGPNASGKSNLLDVFRFLHDISRQKGGGLQNAVALRGGLSKIRCLAARQDPEVSVEVYLAETAASAPLWRYQLGIKQQPRGNRQPYVAEEVVWRGDERILMRPNPED
jgi:predicted ATPase